jgi:hypothetical protein
VYEFLVAISRELGIFPVNWHTVNDPTVDQDFDGDYRENDHEFLAMENFYFGKPPGAGQEGDGQSVEGDSDHRDKGSKSYKGDILVSHSVQKEETWHQHEPEHFQKEPGAPGGAEQVPAVAMSDAKHLKAEIGEEGEGGRLAQAQSQPVDGFMILGSHLIP